MARFHRWRGPRGLRRGLSGTETLLRGGEDTAGSEVGSEGGGSSAIAGADQLNSSSFAAFSAISLLAAVATNTINGNNAPNNLTGTDQADLINGFGGGDNIYGLENDDTAFGGNGNDDIFGGLGIDTLYGDANNDSIYGGDDNDLLIGGNNSDDLVGGDGDDTLRGGSAGDDHDGGPGEDTIDYSDSPQGVYANLADNTFADGFAQGDDAVNIEHIIGSSSNDSLVGTNGSSGVDDNFLFGLSGDDVIWGLGGDDTIDGGDGDDTVIGSSGDDYYYGSPGADTFADSQDNDLIDYSGSPAAVAVIMDNDFTFGDNINGHGYGGWAEGDLYIDLNPHNGIIGSDFADTIVGYNVDISPYANTFFGGQGDDTLAPGGDGPDHNNPDNSVGDSIYGGDGSDWASWQLELLPVTVDLSAQRGYHGGDSIFMSSIENAMGSRTNDSLYGSDGDNSLRGLSGADSIFGGSGADALFGGANNDFLLFDPDDVEIIGGSGIDTAMGSDLRDTVQLDSERFNNVFGFAAIERFYLEDGDDIFLGSSNASDFNQLATDGITVFGGSGRDSISMRGEGATAGIDDYVDGGSAYDQIWGGFGNDTLFGGDANDFIYSGRDDDTLYGGSGFDVFYIGQDEGDNVIHDNTDEVNGLVLFWGWESTFGGDYDGVDPSEVSIAYSGNEILITVENGATDPTTVSFTRTYDSESNTWDTPVDILNLWDYGDGEAGNSSTPPPTYERDVWSATFDPNSGEFTAFTLAVDG